MDTLGVAVTFDGTNEIYTKIAIDDFINVLVDDANDGDSADVWLLVE
jgi:hypothetical protein